MPSNNASPFAVIFDMNGVIIDDLSYHRDAFRAFSEQHQRPITNEEFNSELNGRKNSEIMEYLFGRSFEAPEALRLEDEKETLYRDLYREKRETLPGLVEFLEELAANDIPLAIATSAPPENVTFIVDEMNLRKYFRAVVDASQVKKSKPEPDIYLLAAKQIEMPPEKCLVFEDGILGILAAKRAGMKVIGVTTTHTAEEFEGVEQAVANFKGLGFEELARVMR